jgi:hypothetical protein
VFSLISYSEWTVRGPSSPSSEILIDGHAAVVEEHVMVGAKAEYVVRGHRSVVGRPEWAGMRGLRLGLAGSPGECRIPASGGRKGF